MLCGCTCYLIVCGLTICPPQFDYCAFAQITENRSRGHLYGQALRMYMFSPCAFHFAHNNRFIKMNNYYFMRSFSPLSLTCCQWIIWGGGVGGCNTTVLNMLCNAAIYWMSRGWHAFQSLQFCLNEHLCSSVGTSIYLWNLIKTNLGDLVTCNIQEMGTNIPHL